MNPLEDKYFKLHDRYLLYQNIGKGAFGSVYKAFDPILQRYVAIKEIKQAFIVQYQDLGRRLFSAEINGMKYLNNPHLLHCDDLFKARNERYEDCYYIVMDFCNGGSLADHISIQTKVSQNQGLEYLRQMLIGLSELHKNNVLHRDLKLTNIMLKDGKIIIIDLGFAKQVDDYNSATTTVGTPGYMAPEILMQSGSYDSKVDIFSLGVILFKMVLGYEPFEINPKNNFQTCQNYQRPIIFPNQLQISQQFKDLLIRMLKFEVNDRISFKELYEHPLIQEGNGRNIHNLGQNQLNPNIYQQNNLQQQLKFKSYQELQNEFVETRLEICNKNDTFNQIIAKFENKVQEQTHEQKQFMNERNFLLFFETVGLKYSKIFPHDPKSLYLYYGLLKMQCILLRQLYSKLEPQIKAVPQIKQQIDQEIKRVEGELGQQESKCNEQGVEIRGLYQQLFNANDNQFQELLKQMIVETYLELESYDNNYQENEETKFAILTVHCLKIYERNQYSGCEFETQDNLLTQRFIKQDNLFS